MRQVRFALRLMAGAKSAVRDRNNRAKELRLLPDVQRLLESVTETDQLGFMQERAVHEHSRRPSIVANAYGQRQVRITRHCGSGRISQVRSDDRVDTRVDYTINARARSGAGMRSRGDVGGIVRITWELFR